MRKASAAVFLVIGGLAATVLAAPNAPTAQKGPKGPKAPRAAPAADAGAPDADAALSWVHSEFAQAGYPNGWLVASQGNSPKNWAGATIGGVSTLNLFTDDATGGVACASASACPASQ